jgi:hypothetical protein
MMTFTAWAVIQALYILLDTDRTYPIVDISTTLAVLLLLTTILAGEFDRTFLTLTTFTGNTEIDLNDLCHITPYDAPIGRWSG